MDPSAISRKKRHLLTALLCAICTPVVIYTVKFQIKLGFDLDAIAELIALQEAPQAAHGDAHRIAKDRIFEVQDRIARLRRLEAELVRVVNACDGQSDGQPCRVLHALADHQACEGEH